jgi:hypothetical protein
MKSRKEDSVLQDASQDKPHRMAPHGWDLISPAYQRRACHKPTIWGWLKSINMVIFGDGADGIWFTTLLSITIGYDHLE